MKIIQFLKFNYSNTQSAKLLLKKKHYQELQQIVDYQDAESSYNKQQYSQCEQLLQRMSHYLQQDNDKNKLIIIQEKLVKVNAKMNNKQQLEQNLNKMLENKLNNNFDKDDVFESQKDLLLFQLNEDSQKSIESCKQILRDLSKEYQQEIYQILACSYICEEKYEQARNILLNQIQSEKEFNKCLNNLAVCNWFELKKNKDSISINKLDQECFQYLKESLLIKERNNNKLEMNDEQKQKRYQILKGEIKLQENIIDLNLQNQYSGIEFLNICEILVEMVGKGMEKETGYWCKEGLKYCEKEEQNKYLGMMLVILARLHFYQNQRINSEGLYRHAIGIFKDRQDSYGLQMGLIGYSQLLKTIQRSKEADALIQQANNLQFPSNISTLYYLHLPISSISLLSF